MPDTYPSKTAAAADRACLDELRAALNVAHSAVRLDECRLWTIRGSRATAPCHIHRAGAT